MSATGETRQLTDREALDLLNRVRSNIIATQSASWSNAAYPLVAILNAAGYELMGATDGQREEHVGCYGGAGGWPKLMAETPVPEDLLRSTGLRREGRENDGTLMIHAERWRQIEGEGWTPEHDDEHRDGALAFAARCYVLAALVAPGGLPRPPQEWPWDESWWKPSDDPIRNLVKAGALIAAEIDRLTRAKREDARPSDSEAPSESGSDARSQEGGS